MYMSKHKTRIYSCEKCGELHDGSYGSGRFCSAKCSRSFSSSHVSEEGRLKQTQTLNDSKNREKCMQARMETRKKMKHSKKDISHSELKESFKNRTMALGKYGENQIINKCLLHDIPVYLPVVDTNGVDMIFDINGEYKKVQVKSSTLQRGVNSDRTAFTLQSLIRKNDKENKLIKYHKDGYQDKVDLFALYDGINDRSYLIDSKSIQTKSIAIAQDKTALNGQTANINAADDYDFDRVIEKLKNGTCDSNVIVVDCVTQSDDE